MIGNLDILFALILIVVENISIKIRFSFIWSTNVASNRGLYAVFVTASSTVELIYEVIVLMFIKVSRKNVIFNEINYVLFFNWFDEILKCNKPLSSQVFTFVIEKKVFVSINVWAVNRMTRWLVDGESLHPYCSCSGL